MKRIALTVILALTFAGGGAEAQPTCEDRYFVTLFGGHGNIFRPRTGHTWAIFTHTYPGGDGRPVAEQFTISWLPATLNIRPFALQSETGVNLSHEQTMHFMASHRLPWVRAFGPYEIDATRFAQAQRQLARLESGGVRYHALGLFGTRTDVMHCIDAVTRTDPEWERQANPALANGVLGTAQAVRAMDRSGFADKSITHRDYLPLPAIPQGCATRVRER